MKNDTSCTLKVTEVVADQTYSAAAPIALSAAYNASATTFAPSGGGAVAFAANAKLDAVDFANNFTLTLLYSDDVTSTNADDVTGTYATVSSSTSTLVVTPPNYTISLTAGTPFTIQLDANKVVQSVSGSATLTDGSVTGTTYAIDNGTLLPVLTYAGVGLAYGLATERTISGANPTIPASYFGLVGQSLASNVTRTIIVARTVNGVKAYQLFKVVFKAP